MGGESSEWELIDAMETLGLVKPSEEKPSEEKPYLFESPTPLNISQVIPYLRKTADGNVVRNKDGTCVAILSIEDLQFKMRIDPPCRVELVDHESIIRHDYDLIKTTVNQFLPKT